MSGVLSDNRVFRVRKSAQKESRTGQAGSEGARMQTRFSLALVYQRKVAITVRPEKTMLADDHCRLVHGSEAQTLTEPPASKGPAPNLSSGPRSRLESEPLETES